MAIACSIFDVVINIELFNTARIDYIMNYVEEISINIGYILSITT